MSKTTLFKNLAGALSRAYEDVGSKWGGNHEVLFDRLGSFYKGLTHDPEYFATSKVVPQSGDDVRIMRELERKHGLGQGDLRLEYDGGLLHRPSGASIGNTGETPNEIRSYISKNAPPPWGYLSREEKLKFSEAGRLNPELPFWEMDMMGADKGSGTAKTLYPLFTDWIMAHPGTGARTVGLTEANAQKRGVYQAQALEKYGPAMLNRIQNDAAQLDNSWGTSGNHATMLGMDTQGQIGAYNALLAQRTNEKLRDLLKLGKEEHGTLDFSKAMEAEMPEDMRSMNENSLLRHELLTKALGRARMFGLDKPSVNMDFPAAQSIINDLSKGISQPIPVGQDSLRRAAITNSYVQDPGLDMGDLMGTPIVKALARAKGGSVTTHHTHAGPLTQCSCGAK
jgi:hypothetical protein